MPSLAATTAHQSASSLQLSATGDMSSRRSHATLAQSIHNDIAASEGAAATRVPRAVQWLVANVVAPCFEEGEDFEVFIRKAAVLTYSLMASAGWMLTLAFTIIATHAEGGFTAPRLNMICMGMYMLVWYVLGNYMYIRKTKRCPLWLADLASLGAVLGMASFTIATLEADTRVLLMATLLLTAMCSSPRFAVLAFAHAAVYVFHYLRTNFRKEIPGLVFEWDETPSTVVEKVFLFFVLSVVPSLGAVVGMYVVISRYIRRSGEGEAAFVMSLEVADAMQRYDCDSIGATLTRFKDGGKADLKLVGAFAAIRENLMTYRPHIPQYLIQAAIERADEHASEPFIGIDDVDSDANAAHETICKSDDEGSLDLDPRDTDRHETISLSSRTSRSSRCTRVIRVPELLQSAHLPLCSAQTFSGPVTSGYITPGFSTAVAALSSLSHVVESLNAVAKLTGASIHHINGDMIFVTWNATRRVGTHEIRACSFATRALESIRAAAPGAVAPYASLVTTHGSALFAGTTSMHFALVGDDQRIHEQQLVHAKEHKTTVVNDAIVRGSETQHHFVAFAQDKATRQTFFELVGPRVVDGTDEEWLYHCAESHHDIAYRSVHEALRAMDAGDYAEARSIVSSLPVSISSRSTVQSMLERISIHNNGSISNRAK